MESKVLIHNDEEKCFHVAVQGTQKMVVMGYINFVDEALIRRRWTSKRMNVMGGKLKDENKWGNCWNLFLFIAESCECFQSSRVHRSMNAENAI
jgi:hypothetical protein